jgi:hypothetical protein
MPTYDFIVAAYMPNLENLKKQAKLILRWHRERYYPVAAQIRGHLPRSCGEFLSSAMRKKWSQDSKASIVGKP